MQHTSKHWFKQGILATIPFLLVIIPFGLLFGVVATEAGFKLVETMAMTIFVIAGASQFTAVALMTDNVPTLLVIITAASVNLRMAMYSASIAPHFQGLPLWQRALAAYGLLDQTYVVGVAGYEANTFESSRHKLAYYLGALISVAPFWYLSTLAGALLGTTIPESYALDFAIPITFIAMIAPMLKSLAHIATAVVSVILGLVLSGLPYSLSILVAGLISMCVGAQVELWLQSTQAKHTS